MAGRSVSIGLRATHQRLQGDLRRAKSRYDRFFTDVSGSGTRAWRRVRQASKLALAAASAAVVGLTVHLRRSISLADDLAKGAAKTGLGVRAYQELGFAAEQMGSSQEVLERAVLASLRAVKQAGDGMATYQRALKDVGLEYSSLRAMGVERQFLSIRSALSEVRDEARRLALTQELFGGRGRDLGIFTAVSDAELSRLRRQYRDLGLGFSESSARRAEELNDRLNILRHSIRSFSDGFLHALHELGDGDEALRALSDTLRLLGRHLGGVTRRWGNFIARIRAGLDRIDTFFRGSPEERRAATLNLERFVQSLKDQRVQAQAAGNRPEARRLERLLDRYEQALSRRSRGPLRLTVTGVGAPVSSGGRSPSGAELRDLTRRRLAEASARLAETDRRQPRGSDLGPGPSPPDEVRPLSDRVTQSIHASLAASLARADWQSLGTLLVSGLGQAFADEAARMASAVFRPAIHALLTGLRQSFLSSVNSSGSGRSWLSGLTTTILGALAGGPPAVLASGLTTSQHAAFRMHRGGRVPGAPGTETWRLLEAGEQVIPADRGGGGSPVEISQVFNVTGDVTEATRRAVRADAEEIASLVMNIARARGAMA